MSLLDTIKNIFFNNNVEKPELTEVQPESDNQVSEVVKKEIVEEKVAMAPEVKPEPVSNPKPEIKIETVVEIKNQVLDTNVPKAKIIEIKIPEDSTLKRHFITSLKTDIQSGLLPRPTDSTLKRHYDALVQAELEKILA